MAICVIPDGPLLPFDGRLVEDSLCCSTTSSSSHASWSHLILLLVYLKLSIICYDVKLMQRVWKCGNPIFFSFLGAECKISFDAGRIHCKAELCTKDDRMTIVCAFYDILQFLHPLPRSPTFDPGNLPYFHLNFLVFQACFFFLRPPKGGDVEIAFVERSHKSEAVPVLTWKN